MPKKVNRMSRVNQLLKEALAELIEREWTGNNLISVTRMETAPDLHDAQVFISVFNGTEESEQAALTFLRRHRVELQKAVSREITLKYTPVLRFIIDHNLSKGDHVLEILNHLEQENQDEQP